MYHFVKHQTRHDQGKEGGELALLISGFKKQDIVALKEIVTAIDALPAFHLEGLNELVYNLERDFHDLSPYLLPEPGFMPAVNVHSKAEYVREDGVIVVYDFDRKGLFYHILYHEIAHHVYSHVIDGKTRKPWVTELYPRSKHVSQYAATNAAEDFAESYAAYVQYPEALQKIPKKYQYMRDQIFSATDRPPAREGLDITI